MTTPWITKYRPNAIDNVKLDETIKDAIKQKIANTRTCESASIDNFIFTGPCGTGKTTLARCIGNEILGNEFNTWFLELNASNDRGIQTVKYYIQHFASRRAPRIPFKIVFLDEADSLTSQAQEALCQLIEQYENTTRFILSCNDYQRIIELMRTRCTFIEFYKLSMQDIINKIDDVLNKENITAQEEAKKSIAQYSNGDARRALTIVQTLAITRSSIKDNDVHELCDDPETYYIKQIIESCEKKDFPEVRKNVKHLIHKGITLFDIVELILKMSESYNSDITYTLFLYRFEITSELQLEGLLADICSKT